MKNSIRNQVTFFVSNQMDKFIEANDITILQQVSNNVNIQVVSRFRYNVERLYMLQPKFQIARKIRGE